MRIKKLTFLISLTLLFAIGLQFSRIVENYNAQKSRVYLDLSNILDKSTDSYFLELGKTDKIIFSVKNEFSTDIIKDSFITQKKVKVIDSIYFKEEEGIISENIPRKIYQAGLSKGESNKIHVNITRDTLDLKLFESLVREELPLYKLQPIFKIIHIHTLNEPEKMELVNTLPAKQLIEAKSVHLPKNQKIFMFFEAEPKQLIQRGATDIFVSLIFIGLITYAFVILYSSIKTQKEMEEMRRNFTGFVSHELRGPLTNAVIALESWKDHSGLKDHRWDWKTFDILSKNLISLDEISQRILETSSLSNKQKQLVKKEFDLIYLLEECVYEHERLFNRDIIFENNLNNALITADFEYLKSTFNIILNNACKYGGEKIRVVLKKSRSYVISFMDNGKGIPIEKQKKIFNQYYRAVEPDEDKPKGYGIGLYQAKLVIESHKGSIKHKFSEPWTIFQITLPTK